MRILINILLACYGNNMYAHTLRFLAELVTPDNHTSWRWELKNHILRKLGLKIGQCVAIDSGFECLDESKLIISDYAAIGKNARIYNFSDVKFGKFCMVAGELLIANGGHDKRSFEPFSGSLFIGNGCWIGTGAKIVGANIHIGDNSIVGAGALVNKSVPERAIVAGNPARIIGYRVLCERVWHFGSIWFSPHTFEEVK